MEVAMQIHTIIVVAAVFLLSVLFHDHVEYYVQNKQWKTLGIFRGNQNETRYWLTDWLMAATNSTHDLFDQFGINYFPLVTN